jgi:peptide-methionine (S)-S-oxide reductase
MKFSRATPWSFLIAAVSALTAFALYAADKPLPGELPAPATDQSLAAASGRQSAVLAGGCFWGIQAVFQHVGGVIAVTSGYAGGSADSASYGKASSGITGHAESVKIDYDPA